MVKKMYDKVKIASANWAENYLAQKGKQHQNMLRDAFIEGFLKGVNLSKKHGHWIRNDNGTYSCSECQSWIPNEQYYYARYCLHCGAKMGGGENETNVER